MRQASRSRIRGRWLIIVAAVLMVAAGALAFQLRPQIRAWSRRPTRLDEEALVDLARAFDVEEAMGVIAELSSPRYAGRAGGSPEGDLAAEYLAEQFAAAGLEPAGADGYLQPFDTPYARLEAVPQLVITDALGTVHDDAVYRQDHGEVWGGYAGGGRATGPVYWVDDGGLDDVADVDVRGGIIFAEAGDVQSILRTASEHGAVGALILADTETRIDRKRSYREEPVEGETLPALWIDDDVAAHLLVGTPYDVLELPSLDQAFPLDATATIEVLMDEPGTATAQNVLGLLPGADPELKDELVIVGAHYDHLGDDPNGAYYPGANDDASGTAAVVEIARSWRAEGYVPRRSVLFAAWDAEEKGLFGAIHYVRHPVRPLSDTVGMVQIEMLGLVSEGVLTIDGSEGDLAARLRASAAQFDTPVDDLAWSGGSDHAVFMRSSVPAVLIIWDGADVPYYHTPADTVDTLEPEWVRRGGVIASHVAAGLASDVPYAP